MSELVELASQGHEILITVRGRVKARLVPAEVHHDERAATDWMDQLTELGDQYVTRVAGPTIDEILAEQREDRVRPTGTPQRR